MFTTEQVMFEITQTGNASQVKIENQEHSTMVGVWHFTVKYDEPEHPNKVELRFRIPDMGIFSVWSPDKCPDYPSPVWFGNTTTSRAAKGAPIQSLVDKSGKNCMTLAVSDPKTPLEIRTGICEGDVWTEVKLSFFTIPMGKLSEYEADIRIDFREIPFYRAVEEVREWWTSYGYFHADVPETARYPLYSTWYSFHHRLSPNAVVEQCRMAKELGCSAVIVDDGWQTEENLGGYGTCGDWECSPVKIPDMRDFVEQVHALGMKFILWYSIPFVGKRSKAWTHFHHAVLDNTEEKEWYCLDPRFPQVREYLIGIYERAVREWDLDGFKLDFIDSFNFTEASSHQKDDGRDFDSLEDAIEALLSETMARLKAIKSDICIEFRQEYIGPLMQTYGNMLRVADCPADGLSNRIGMVKLRLLSGTTAVHSDMLEWNIEDSAENAALQLLNVFYTVPQISVLLDKIPESHRRMLKFYLGVWETYRNVILDGNFAVAEPSGNYTWISAEKDGVMLTALYGQTVFSLHGAMETLILLNATGEEKLYLDSANLLSGKTCYIYNCMGEEVEKFVLRSGEELLRISVPISGMVKVE